jgi:phosphotransferase family enzyme
MRNLSFQFPDADTIRNSLVSGLSDIRGKALRVTIKERRAPLCDSTASCEVVVCEVEGQSQQEFFFKYGGQSNSSHGARGGLDYETKVYSNILSRLDISTPKLYGSRVDALDLNWLIIEYLGDSLLLSEVPWSKVGDEFPRHAAMNLAASWLGRFHSMCEAINLDEHFSFINIYNSDYYVGWVRRTKDFAGRLDRPYRWVNTVCSEFEKRIPVLLNGSRTVVHGEFSPNNILVRNDTIFPVDWESAAIARGEIDVASAVEGWNKKIAHQFVDCYKASRWPDGVPDDFETVLNLARVYWSLRWLGERLDWTLHEGSRRQFQRLLKDSKRAGLI